MLSIIAALNQNYLIGKDNNLVWHIKEDLKRFKKITTGKTIVMGRKTFESLPGILPNRKHIVITRDTLYSVPSNCVSVIHNIDKILDFKNSSEEIFIIGGGEIYRQFLPFAKRLYLTKIISDETGDTYFPKFKYNDYTTLEFEEHMDKDIKYTFMTLEKKNI